MLRRAVIAALAGLALLAGVATPAPAVTTRPVLVIGDSLTEDALPYLGSALAARGLRPSPAASARSGRSVSEGLAVLTATRGRPPRVLLALGTNDCDATSAQASAWIARARRIVGASTTLYWVNVRAFTESCQRNFPRINRGLLLGVRADNAAQRAAGRAGRSFVLDWSRYVVDAAIRFESDRTHLPARSSRLRAAFYANALMAYGGWARYRLA